MAGEFGISMLTERLIPEVASRKPPENKESAFSAEAGPSFQDLLKNAIGEVNTALENADQASLDFSTGKAKDLHEVMIAIEKADISLRTLTAVRGKVVDAYQEIMRMQV